MGKRNGHHYTDQEVERGLVAVAMCSGNYRRAAQLLEQQDLPIPASTLRDWLTRRAEDYTQVREQTMPKLNAQLAEQHTQLVRANMELEDELRKKITEQKDEIPARDLPGALRNVSTSTGIHSDKARLLRGEPTQIVQSKDAAELQRALEAHGFVISLGPQDVQELPEGSDEERDETHA
jgi:hypothetical protein